MNSANILRRLDRVVIFAMFLAAVVSVGCATPVGMRRMDSPEAHGRLAKSVLASKKLSAPTVQILNRYGLAGKFGDEPAEVIAAIHRGLPTAREPDRIFALAELSFLHAKQCGDATYFFASAVYAYAFLFPLQAQDSPDAFDPRLRTAVDLYNQGLAEGFSEKDPKRMVLKDGTTSFISGSLTSASTPKNFGGGRSAWRIS